MLIDITGGPPGAAEGIAAAAGRLGCDLVVYVDVGGDALAAGDEPGLASPLCDAIMLAAGLRLAGRLDGVATVIGAGCDGELTPDEVLARVAALARAGAWIGASSVTAEQADELERGRPRLPHRGEPAGRALRPRRAGEADDPRRPPHGAPRARSARSGFFFDLEARGGGAAAGAVGRPDADPRRRPRRARGARRADRARLRARRAGLAERRAARRRPAAPLAGTRC